MTFNPFEQKAKPVCDAFECWKDLLVRPYDKKSTDPYTKLRIILMNGTEFEANWYSHQFSRHCSDNDLRREIALIRRVEQQQQKKLSSLKPTDESVLETTIGYEQLAVELTANLARREKDCYVKAALDFALLEDFDHLYRFSNMLMHDMNVNAAELVARRTEITPGRPTISEHRYPADDVRRAIDNRKSDPITRLNAAIITAAEQQTMNFYMNVGNTYPTEEGKKLYLEIAMIEEEHVTHYGSLTDTACTWLAGLVEHEYTECYLYYSCAQDETDPRIRAIWEALLEQELSHLHKAAELLEKYEKRDYTALFPEPAFPEPLTFGKDNIGYVRDVLKNTVCLTSKCEDYTEVSCLKDDDVFFSHNKRVNGRDCDVPSHAVIDSYLRAHGEDFRFETAPNPVAELSSRVKDNVRIGRSACQQD